MNRKFSRRDVLQGGAALTSGALLGGALPLRVLAQSGSPEAPVLGGPVSFWSRETQQDGARKPLINDRLAAFDEAFGTVSTAQFMTFSESVTKEQAALAAGTPPDLGQQGPDVAAQFAGGGHLLPIDDVAAALDSQLVPLGKVAFVQLDGITYTVPWYVETRGLLYHMDLLDAAGVAPPTTWQEWSDAAAALTKGDEQYGLTVWSEGTSAGQLFIPLATSAGGNVVTADGSIDASGPPFVDALQLLADMYTARSMPPGQPTYTDDQAEELFVAKKAAMMVANNGTWSRLRADPAHRDTVGLVRIPVQTIGDISRGFFGGWQLFVFAKGQNPAAAKQLIPWLLDDAWYTDYVTRTEGGALPITTAAAAADIFQTDPGLKLLTEATPDAVRYTGTLVGNAPWVGEAEGQLLFSNPVFDVWNGVTSVEDGVQAMDASLKAVAGQ